MRTNQSEYEELSNYPKMWQELKRELMSTYMDSDLSNADKEVALATLVYMKNLEECNNV